MATHFILEGVALPTPQNYKTEDYNITDSKRLMNGNMVMSFIAAKRKFYLTYDYLSLAQIRKLKSILVTSHKMFLTFKYQEGDEWFSATVYTGAFTKTLAKAYNSHSWVWKDVEIHLIEV